MITIAVAVIGIIALCLTVLLIKMLKKNKWYLFGALLLLYGVVVTNLIRYTVSIFQKTPFFSLDVLVNFVACIALSVVLFIIGYRKK